MFRKWYIHLYILKLLISRKDNWTLLFSELQNNYKITINIKPKCSHPQDSTRFYLWFFFLIVNISKNTYFFARSKNSFLTPLKRASSITMKQERHVPVLVHNNKLRWNNKLSVCLWKAFCALRTLSRFILCNSLTLCAFSSRTQQEHPTVISRILRLVNNN